MKEQLRLMCSVMYRRGAADKTSQTGECDHYGWQGNRKNKADLKSDPGNL